MVLRYPSIRTIPSLVKLEEQERCEDAAWMQTNTHYPAGTVCYKDPSKGDQTFTVFRFFLIISKCDTRPSVIPASCVDFGSSGSGVVRQAMPYLVNNTGHEDPDGGRQVYITRDNIYKF